ncbi:MAG: ROK family protein [Hyphomicrobiales bacterium]|nr:ROK family protein [Hyphomicrobiales bacterium]
MTLPRLVADVGGTNVRFAIADAEGRIERVRRYTVAGFASFADALSQYRAGVGDVAGCAIAAAGPVVDDAVDLTNNDWRIERATVAELLGDVPVVLINDLEAVAAALPHLPLSELTSVGAPQSVRPERRTMLAINVGTGFGAASVIRRDGRWYTCPSEAGHMTLAGIACDSDTPADDAGFASIESVLSGAGLVNLYRRLARPGDPAIGEASAVLAARTHHAAAARAVDRFSAVLGRVAGDLVLATCSWGGVHLCGSVALAWPAREQADRFRAAFAGSGPMSERLRQVPTAVIERAHVALSGLALIPLSR